MGPFWAQILGFCSRDVQFSHYGLPITFEPRYYSWVPPIFTLREWYEEINLRSDVGGGASSTPWGFRGKNWNWFLY